MPTASTVDVMREAHDVKRSGAEQFLYLELACLRIIDFLLIGYLRGPGGPSSSISSPPALGIPSAHTSAIPIPIIIQYNGIVGPVLSHRSHNTKLHLRLHYVLVL